MRFGVNTSRFKIAANKSIISKDTKNKLPFATAIWKKKERERKRKKYQGKTRSQRIKEAANLQKKRFRQDQDKQKIENR